MSRTLGVLRQLLDQALPGHRPAHEDYELVETGTSNLYSPLPLLCFSSYSSPGVEADAQSPASRQQARQTTMSPPSPRPRVSACGG